LVSFGTIFGQAAAVETIRRAYQADRLPHGLIFAGPAGVGKGTTARALAALLLCETPNADAPCGRCESCRVFEAGNHPDYHVVYRQLIRIEKDKSKARDLPVDVIRDFLIAPAGRKASMGRAKVFVVEEADLMNPTAQNALLKTLEEPYGRTVIVLLTDQPGALLPTIRSRCQLVRFAALPESLVRKELEKRGVDPSIASVSSRLASGSLGVALKWVEDGVISAAGELTAQIDRIAAGSPPDDLPAWFRRAAEAYAEKQLERDKLSSKDMATREGLSLYLRIAAEHVRRKMPEAQGAGALELACATIDALARAELYLDENVNVPLALQQLASTLEQATLTAKG
jgi:DNA polymerase-3 subunit delta'